MTGGDMTGGPADRDADQNLDAAHGPRPHDHPAGTAPLTAPTPEELMGRRIAALEAEHFALLVQLRTIGDATERNAQSLDDLETALIDLSTNPPPLTEDVAAALAQRQAQLDAQDPTMAPNTVPTATVPTATAPAAAADSGQPVPSVDLDVLHGWVTALIAPSVRKTTTTGEGGGIRWCRVWWLHPDAVQRFTALYLAFTQLSAEESPVWLSVFLRDHLDPHLAVLTSPFGPFHACTPYRHSTAIQPLGHAELAVSSISGGIDDQPGDP